MFCRRLPSFFLEFAMSIYPITVPAFSSSFYLSSNLFRIFEVLSYVFSMLRVLLTTTTIIETIRVPQIAIRSTMNLPMGV